MADPKKIEEDKALINACIKGDKAAGDRLVEQYSKLIYNSIYRTFEIKCWTPSDIQIVEDLYHQIILRLYEDDFKRLKQYTGKANSSLATWLQRVVKNFIIDFIEKEFNRASKTEFLPNTDSDRDEEKNPKRHLKVESNTVEDLTKDDISELLNQALGSLPKDERTLIELLFYEKIPHEKVAQIMGKSLDAIYMQKKRILKKLKNYFKKAVGIDDITRLL